MAQHTNKFLQQMLHNLVFDHFVDIMVGFKIKKNNIGQYRTITKKSLQSSVKFRFSVLIFPIVYFKKMYFKLNKFKGALSSLRQILVTENLKMKKNAFYFILKGFYVLKIFTFLSWVFGHVKSDLIRKKRLISKFMISQPV